MTACATTEQLERFLRDDPGCLENETMGAHIEDCPACQQALDRLISAGAGAGATPRSGSPVLDDRDVALIERLKRRSRPLRQDSDESRGSDAAGYPRLPDPE
jgi:hypothetical protein